MNRIFVFWYTNLFMIAKKSINFTFDYKHHVFKLHTTLKNTLHHLLLSPFLIFFYRFIAYVFLNGLSYLSFAICSMFSNDVCYATFFRPSAI